VSISVTNRDDTRTGSGSFTVTRGAFGLSVTPSTVGAGLPARLDIANRYGASVVLTFRSGSTVLDTMTVNADTTTITPPLSWFETAGSTSTSLSVSIGAVASDGRTASGSMTVKETLAVSGLSPSGGTRTATDSMHYSWYLSGRTSQVSAIVEYKTSGNSWEYIGRVEGSDTWLYSGVKPPPGTVTWRVRVTNSLGYETVSAEASFTLQYVSTSYLAPYNTPTTGSIDRFSSNTFSCEMRPNGTPYVPWTIRNPVL
jgi:hypothetical protein